MARSPIPGNRGQQLGLRGERAAGLADARVQPGDHVGKVIDVFQVQGTGDVGEVYVPSGRNASSGTSTAFAPDRKAIYPQPRRTSIPTN